MSEPTVRVRGIYATALTVLIRDAGFDVVDPSPPVRERIGGPFPAAVPTVRVESSADRFGVQITGIPDHVARVSDALESLSGRSFAVSASLPSGVVRSGMIDRTSESGAIVSVGDAEAFLPYGRSDSYVSGGDRTPVQVIDPVAPWTPDRRPVVATRPRVPGIYLSLVRDEERSPIDAPEMELARMVELLDPAVPAPWSVVVHRQANDVYLDILRRELERLEAERDAIETAFAAASDPDEPGGVYAPAATRWCRFGREARFALDEWRGKVTPTVGGHHRLKAADEAAGTAVDYLEHVDADIAFDPAATFACFGPAIGDRLRIDHGKPTGETIVLGRGEVIGHPQPDAVTVRRELSAGGTLDALDVPIEAGDTAETTFVEGKRWAATVYRDADGDSKGTYANVSTPVEIFPDRVSYVDLYVDVIKTTDGTVAVVDDEELAAAADENVLADDIADEARTVAASLERSLDEDASTD